MCFSLQKRLSEIGDQVIQINKEEELFKWELSTYPQIEAISSSMEPYHRLFSTVLRWQKAEKKFMDGSFLELNAEDTQAEVYVIGCLMFTCMHLCVTCSNLMNCLKNFRRLYLVTSCPALFRPSFQCCTLKA